MTWRRRALNLAALVALAVCVATVALWVRSDSAYDRWLIAPQVGRYASGCIESDRGVIRGTYVPGANRGINASTYGEMFWKRGDFLAGRGLVSLERLRD